MFDWIGDLFDGLMGIITDAISSALGNFIGKLCYYVVSAGLKIVEVVYRFFGVFSGGTTVKYQESDKFLVDVFFGNSRINQVYWGMALIGFVIIIAVTIVAVIKKSFDSDGKEQRSLGTILMDAGRSGLTILLISFAMTAVLNLTNVLIGRITYLFNNAGSLDTPLYMEFSDEQFAAMARIYNTVGNYSLNGSYNSRYNLNSCYNEIREDLYMLQEDMVFDFSYDTSEGETWQSMLAKLDRAGDPSVEHSLEIYDSSSAVILEMMEVMRTNKSFYPVQSVTNSTWGGQDGDVSIDRILFLMGTLSAARNSRFNKDAQITDGLRGAYYRGEKNIYSFDQVTSDFNTGLVGIQYVTIVLAGWFTLKSLFLCIMNCIARIFNLLGLYIIAPPIAGLKALDGGAMFKQWVQAATIQMFNIFGAIIPMRLVILFIPIILSGDLVFFSSVTLNIMAKVVMIVAGLEAAEKFGEVITGILAGASGMAAMKAGDMSNMASGAASALKGGAAAALGGAAKVGKGMWNHSTLGAGVNKGVKAAGKAIKGSTLGKFAGVAAKNGLLGAVIPFGGKGTSAWSKFKKEEAKKEKEAAEKKDLDKRRERVALAKLERDEKKLGLAPRKLASSGDNFQKLSSSSSDTEQQDPNSNPPQGGDGGPISEQKLNQPADQQDPNDNPPQGGDGGPISEQKLNQPADQQDPNDNPPQGGDGGPISEQKLNQPVDQQDPNGNPPQGGPNPPGGQKLNQSVQAGGEGSEALNSVRNFNQRNPYARRGGVYKKASSSSNPEKLNK